MIYCEMLSFWCSHHHGISSSLDARASLITFGKSIECQEDGQSSTTFLASRISTKSIKRCGLSPKDYRECESSAGNQSCMLPRPSRVSSFLTLTLTQKPTKE